MPNYDVEQKLSGEQSLSKELAKEGGELKGSDSSAIIAKLKHSSNIAADLAALYADRPYVYARVIQQLGKTLGSGQVRKLHVQVMERAKALKMEKASAAMEAAKNKAVAKQAERNGKQSAVRQAAADGAMTVKQKLAAAAADAAAEKDASASAMKAGKAAEQSEKKNAKLSAEAEKKAKAEAGLDSDKSQSGASGSDKKMEAEAAKSKAGAGKSGETAGGGAGGGGAGGGGGAVPAMGAGAPEVKAKGEGGGGNAVEAFANSGTSYQFEHHSGLGSKVDADAEKTKSKMDASLPGEEGGQINDGSADEAHEQALDNTRTANESLSETQIEADLEVPESDTSELDSQKSTISGASEEDLPDKPVVDADYSGIETAEAESSAKFDEGKSEGDSKIESVDMTIEPRGFEDIKAPKVDMALEDEPLVTDELSASAEVASLTDEGKGILDVSEFAESSSAEMEGAKSQVAEAEQQRQSDADAAIEQHNEAVEQAKADAAEQEQQAIDENQTAFDEGVSETQASYESEMTGYGEEQSQAVSEAEAEMDSEKAKAQADVDQEFQNSKKEKEEAEKEGEGKKKKSWLEKVGDAIKSAVDAVVSWLKEKVASIVKKLKNAICKLLDAFVAVVSRINKNLGEKLRKIVDKIKDALDKLAQALIDLVNKILDAIAEAVKAIVDAVVEAIQQFIDDLLNALKALWEAFKAALAVALEIIKTALSALADLFIIILKKAMEIAGVDTAALAPALDNAKEVINHPGDFFRALGEGIVNGFKNFFGNMPENIIQIGKNLLNLWLGCAGVSLPEALSVPCLIKFGLELIGIDVNSILEMLGLKDVFDQHVKDAQAKNKKAMNKVLGRDDKVKEAEQAEADEIEELKTRDMSEDSEESEVMKFYNEVKVNGISAIVPYMLSHVGDLVGEIVKEAIKTIAMELVKKGIAKLASLASPVSGIIMALKAVWDLIQFVRQNFSAIASLGAALLNVLGSAAQGDSSAVASAVEAVICQGVPLLIDALLRFVGLDMGAKVQKLVMKIRAKVQTVFDKIIGPFKKKADALKKKVKNSDKVKNAEKKVKNKFENSSRLNSDKAQARNKKAGEWGRNVEYRTKAFTDKTKSLSTGMSKTTDILNGKKDGTLYVNDKYQKYAEESKKYTEALHEGEVKKNADGSYQDLDTHQSYKRYEEAKKKPETANMTFEEWQAKEAAEKQQKQNETNQRQANMNWFQRKKDDWKTERTEQKNEKKEEKRKKKEKDDKYRALAKECAQEQARKEGKSQEEIDKITGKELLGTLQLDQYQAYKEEKEKSGGTAKDFSTYTSQYMDWRNQDYVGKQTDRSMSRKEQDEARDKAWKDTIDGLSSIPEEAKNTYDSMFGQNRFDKVDKKQDKDGAKDTHGKKYTYGVVEKGQTYVKNGQTCTAIARNYVVMCDGVVVFSSFFEADAADFYQEKVVRTYSQAKSTDGSQTDS